MFENALRLVDSLTLGYYFNLKTGFAKFFRREVVIIIIIFTWNIVRNADVKQY